ncbi:hypothetical protein [Mastigocoleus testarum]|uniref:Uncharacterized protein n=1 Tax=Mastigocoleus testarum BC008 TaxID=371196 RepID=A0A0V7ZGK3_9CYAN|nr:hypothetical protein [Mastigocoleus testarum]KST63559.1 hypothetical protein BC008_13930 [Mastigocoleus testarum BC008]KST68440.1 hypothetical protein BC008_00795 [Mastigocoleus testarum BC008]
MLSRNFIYSTFILIFFTNTVQAQTQISKHHQFVRSNPIGRILSGDRNKEEGSSIFPGDRIHPRSGTVKILCYPNKKILLLGEGLVDDTADKCVKPTELGKCATNNKRNCSRTKTQTTN